MRKAMISQPMNGLTDEQIKAIRENAVKELEEMGYVVLNTLFDDYETKYIAERTNNAPLYYLSQALGVMAMTDLLYCCKGWEGARGCRVEHQAAFDYGVPIMYQEE